MYAGPWRLLRALTVSTTCVALSLASHLVGAGSETSTLSLVGAAGVLMTTVLLMLVLLAVSGMRWTLGRSLVALGAGQVVMHTTFTVLLASHQHLSPNGSSSRALTSTTSTISADAITADAVAMALCHVVAALLAGVAIAVNDSALDSYFAVTSSLVGSGIGVPAFWRLASRVAGAAVKAGAVYPERGDQRFARWRRPRILSDLVVLQCLSRRGPPALTHAA